MFYVTGDKHADFMPIVDLAERGDLTAEDTLIVLGDFGMNYFCLFNKRKKKYEPIKDSVDIESLRSRLNRVPCTILVVQGNHEAPAWLVAGMKFEEQYGGTVCYDPSLPHVKYLLNGEVYNFEGKEYLVMGGAYSLDKKLRKPAVKTEPGLYLWFPEEQMTAEEFEKAEQAMASRDYEIHGILSHTCPKSKMPFYTDHTLFRDIDPRMEEKFDELAQRYKFDVWYFGHYHIDKMNGKFRTLYDSFQELI